MAPTRSWSSDDVLYDAFAVGRPGVNAETEVRSRCHLQRLPPQSSSALRLTPPVLPGS